MRCAIRCPEYKSRKVLLQRRVSHPSLHSLEISPIYTTLLGLDGHRPSFPEPCNRYSHRGLVSLDSLASLAERDCSDRKTLIDIAQRDAARATQRSGDWVTCCRRTRCRIHQTNCSSLAPRLVSIFAPPWASAHSQNKPRGTSIQQPAASSLRPADRTLPFLAGGIARLR